MSSLSKRLEAVEGALPTATQEANRRRFFELVQSLPGIVQHPGESRIYFYLSHPEPGSLPTATDTEAGQLQQLAPIIPAADAASYTQRLKATGAKYMTFLTGTVPGDYNLSDAEKLIAWHGVRYADE
ncbi:MAG: hypothetical protein CL607_28775 [Anaerolineaceae bacterium]|jgi:hypothetical protein|nr:hypothetical protein [Anaerolineaceae bacterium]|tara:strand:- start:350 stop:730 length:381 start_codon:yes stop_codon:yes gene_type:complete